MDRRITSISAIVVLVILAGCGGTIIEGSSTSTPVETPEITSTGTPTPTPSTGSDGPTSPTPNGTLDVHFINVGQGSSTLIVGPTGETILIDSGDWSDDGEDVLAYLDRHDVDRIDHLVTTHADADHIGGHAAIIDHYETQADGIGAVYDPGITSSSQTYARYLDAIEKHDVTLCHQPTPKGVGLSVDSRSGRPYWVAGE